MRQVTRELGVPFIDIFDLSLPMLDANIDGVHFNESIKRSIAMLIVKHLEVVNVGVLEASV